MTSIKPPGASPADRLGSTLPSGSGQGPEPAGPSFRETLEGPASAQSTARPEALPSTPAADAPAELARAVRAGILSPEQALDRMVERAAAMRSLSESQRNELRSLLTEALQADPALRALREALGQ